MAIKLAVFDIAGTTVHDDNSVAMAFTKAFTASGIDISPVNINHLMGYKKTDAISTVLTRLGMNHDQKMVNDINDVFTREMKLFYETADDIRPLPFAEELFAWLKANEIYVALNTGFPRDIADVVVNRLGWQGKIDQYIASNEVPEGRPAPYMIRELMSRAGVTDTSQVIKTGDTDVDILEGRNAHCGIVVAVTTGAYSRQELDKSDPDFIIDNLAELLPIIKDFA